MARTTILEEVAVRRRLRRIWARVMREEFGAENPKSLMLRHHADRRRAADRPAARGQPRPRRRTGPGCRPRRHATPHTNSFDEAIALPTDKSARLALRTQQVLAYDGRDGDRRPFAVPTSSRRYRRSPSVAARGN
ncbi:methylmalonyl-CoA mutase family protein [Streptomyces thinghirensis]|nr:methylmalonyl-CoA mutase family protein [Streptomyces thinghirensis]